MKRPNILWLTTDHHIFANHYDYQPSYKGKLAAFERLCQEGMKFQQAYSVCPLCTPARASMLTGQYPHNHGMILNTPENATDEKAAGTRIDFDTPKQLIGAALKQQGYRIAQFGKWYGGGKTADAFGFEGWTLPWYGNPMRTEAYGTYRERNHLPEPEVEVVWSANEPETIGKRYNLTKPYRYAFGPFSAARRMLVPKECHEAYMTASFAQDWLIDYVNQKEQSPFFLKVDVWGPHHPYDVAPPFEGRVKPEDLLPLPSFEDDYTDKPNQYCQVKARWNQIAEMKWAEMRNIIAMSYEHGMLVDDALGGILSLLDELKLTQNTLVIYTADHGDLLGAHGGLFNKEGLMVEETMRIPLAIRWPGHLSPGQKGQGFASNLDIPATVLAAAGATPDYLMDGINLLAESRTQLMSESFGCFVREHEQRMLRWENYKYIAHLSGEEELYDLDRDRFELANLAAVKAYRTTLMAGRGRLKEELEKAKDQEFIHFGIICRGMVGQSANVQ